MKPIELKDFFGDRIEIEKNTLGLGMVYFSNRLIGTSSVMSFDKDGLNNFISALQELRSKMDFDLED